MKPGCISTHEAEPACTAWIPTGHPYHGCELPHGHNHGNRRGEPNAHECKCGTRWYGTSTVSTTELPPRKDHTE